MYLGPEPAVVTCPFCNRRVVTRTENEPDMKTHLMAVLLFFVGFICCLCFLPYCMSSCKPVRHYCPQCGAYLGTCES
nr:unnamed protein product [Callosobruchus chinensis]